MLMSTFHLQYGEERFTIVEDVKRTYESINIGNTERMGTNFKEKQTKVQFIVSSQVALTWYSQL